MADATRRYHNSLIAYFRQRLPPQEDAADAAQETYMRLMQYEGSRSVHSASALLYRIAANVINDRIRSARARHAQEHCPIDELELADNQPTAEREMEARQDLQQLYQAIEELPPRCHQVFVLSRVHRMTYPEIARHCGITVKMVEKHISHALEICMRKVGGALPHPPNTV